MFYQQVAREKLLVYTFVLFVVIYECKHDFEVSEILISFIFPVNLALMSVQG